MTHHKIFMMGSYEARIPQDRLYSENHLWLKEAHGSRPQAHGSRPVGLEEYTVGFTAYSVRLLQDVFFLDWTLDAEAPVRHRQEIGEIESSKALSTLYAPYEGRILEFNEALLEDPSTINTDNYGEGWLFRFRTEARPMTAGEYVELLDSVWDETQRHLKGQLG